MDKKQKHNQEISMTIPMKNVRHFVEKMKNLEDSTPISFELILTAFFPNAWKNIQKYSNDCYMQGYFDGKKSVEEDEEQKK